MTLHTVAGVPSIARSVWHDHPKFPTQTLLLGSHRNFRRVSAHLVERAAAGENLALRGLFTAWKAAMHSHERYEEGKLYPYLAHRFGIDLGVLEAGHEALAEAEDAVFEAFGGQGLAEAMRHHDAVLLPHLELEEDVVIPCLLSLSAQDFAAYSRHSIGWLLREHPPLVRED